MEQDPTGIEIFITVIAICAFGMAIFDGEFGLILIACVLALQGDHQ